MQRMWRNQGVQQALDRAASSRGWPLTAVLVLAFSLLLAFAPTARAEQAGQQPVVQEDGSLAQSRIYNDDLEVERGQVIDGDVVVYSGDVLVRSEGRIAGTLTVYSGDIDIQEGGSVGGNVTSWSGDVQVDGRVGGSISAMAGDVEIGGAAVIGGDISVMAGDIKQRAGASVGGNLLRGPDLKLPAPPALNWLPGSGAVEATDGSLQAERDGGRGPLAGVAVRGLSALLLLALFVGGAAAVAALRPGWTAEMQSVLRRQSALAFAAGLIANVLLLAVIGFLFITVCLRPPALLLAVGMLALNAAGMAAVGAEIGGRAGERISRGQWTPTARVALGVLLPGAVIAFLWTVGGCFAFFAVVGALLLGSFGVGSILVKALNLGAAPAPAGGAQPSGTSPSAAPAAPAPAAPDAAASAAPAAAPASPSSEAPGSAAGSAAGAAAPWWQEGTAESAPESMAASAPASAAPPAEPFQPPAPVQDREMLPMAQADFTLIEGIGPKLSQRLHAANVRTFADLAGLPPETLAGILGWSSERVLRSNILDRARRLATE